MQMLLVARSRRMCCSRVWRARRKPTLPEESRETPTTRPGVRRACAAVVARNAAWGPPPPMGIPKRWVEPIATSAPKAPGGSSMVSASRSVATTVRAPAWWTFSTSGRHSRIRPRVSGYWTMTPETSFGICTWGSLRSRTSRRMPAARARVSITASVCGWSQRSARKVVRPFPERWHIAIASAAAVASSSSEAPATGKPVMSPTRVWKLSRISSRPCEISDWYGVYWVYQPGSSRMFRRMTGGVMAP